MTCESLLTSDGRGIHDESVPNDEFVEESESSADESLGSDSFGRNKKRRRHDKKVGEPFQRMQATEKPSAQVAAGINKLSSMMEMGMKAWMQSGFNAPAPSRDAPVDTSLRELLTVSRENSECLRKLVKVNKVNSAALKDLTIEAKESRNTMQTLLSALLNQFGKK